jgi:hypothetical protein
MATSTPKIDQYTVEVPKVVVSALHPKFPMWGTASRPTDDPDQSWVYLSIDMGIQVQGRVLVPTESVNEVMRRANRQVMLAMTDTGLAITEVRLDYYSTIGEDEWAVLVR